MFDELLIYNQVLETCTDKCESNGKIDMGCINECGNEYLNDVYDMYDFRIN